MRLSWLAKSTLVATTISGQSIVISQPHYVENTDKDLVLVTFRKSAYAHPFAIKRGSSIAQALAELRIDQPKAIYEILPKRERSLRDLQSLILKNSTFEVQF